MHGSLHIPRQRMIARLRERGIRSAAVLDAMAAVPREDFVEEALRGSAYREDSALPIGQEQTISQPWIVARMTELLEPDGTGTLLEIGTGSGYQAAVAAHLFERVYTVERRPELSAKARSRIRKLSLPNVHFKIFDGTYGWSEFGPYRAILVTAVSPKVPAPLYEQLQEGGRIVIPLADAGDRDSQRLALVRKVDGKPVGSEHGPCRFVPLVGRFGWPA